MRRYTKIFMVWFLVLLSSCHNDGQLGTTASHVGGQPQIANNQFPYVKLLSGPGLNFCSSVCVDPKVVLTSWHCVHADAQTNLVTTGNVKIGTVPSTATILHDDTNDMGYPQQFQAQQQVSHLDLAAVFFGETVCSSFVARDAVQYLPEQPMTLVGFGITKNAPFDGRVKRFANTTLKEYGSWDSTLFDYTYFSPQPAPQPPKVEQQWRSFGMVVTEDNNAYPLPGDSGGALLASCTEGHDLVGITSIGPHKTEWTTKFGLYIDLWSPAAQSVIDKTLQHAILSLADDTELRKNLIPLVQKCGP